MARGSFTEQSRFVVKKGYLTWAGFRYKSWNRGMYLVQIGRSNITNRHELQHKLIKFFRRDSVKYVFLSTKVETQYLASNTETTQFAEHVRFFFEREYCYPATAGLEYLSMRSSKVATVNRVH